jgi:hypothetical protein
MTKPYANRLVSRLWQPIGGASLTLLLASASLAQAQTLPQYSLPFNGTNQYAGVPNTAALEFTTGTVELWVKPTWTVGTHSGANLCLVSERSGASLNGGTRFSLHMGNDMKSIGIWNGGSYETVSYNFSKGLWYHVAAVMTTTSTQFYVNGVLIGATANGINTSRSGYNLKIGVSETEGTAVGNAEYFEGELDEVRVWNTARTAAQIQDNYRAPVSTASAGLVAYYPIDNGILGTGNAAARLLKDYATSSYNGTLYNYWTEQAPTISNFTPARNAVSAPLAGRIAVGFSQNMNSAAASEAALKVFGSHTGKRAGTFAGGGTSVITFDPAQELLPGEQATVIVTTAAKSMGGLGLAKPQVAQFVGKAGGTGQGVLSGFQSLPTSGYPGQLVTADIDGDGDLDLLVPTAYTSVMVRLNDGSGTFGPATSLNVGTSSNNTLAMADIDGDGDLDILVPDYVTNGTVKVLRNNGQGTFAAPTTGAQVGDRPAYVVPADLDGDGDLDLLVSNYGTGRVSVRFNDGAGNFSTPSANAEVAVSSGARHAAVADIDGDGDLDLLSVGYTDPGKVSVRLNNGAGVFTAPATNAELAMATRPYSIAMGDVNGDGSPDMVVANTTTATVSLRLNNGSGVFTAPATASVAEISVANSGLQAVLADIDADGDLDLLATAYSSNGAVSVRLNNGRGVFTAPATGAEVGTGGAALLATGDLDGDGDIDLLASGNSGGSQTQVLFNALAPTISSLSAASGMVSSSIVLTGTNFSGATSVKFNGVTASAFAVNSATQITVVVPVGASSGVISVTTPAGTAVSASPFTLITDLVVSTAHVVAGGTYRNITVASGGVATLGGSVTVSGTLTVQAGGTLNTNCQALTGAGSFTLAAGGTLGICDLAGIAASGSTGAVQLAGTRSFSSDAAYVYNGGDSQVTGSGLPSQVRSFTTTNASTVRLSNALRVSQVLTVAGRGNFDLNGQALTLLSSSAGSALVVNSGTGVVSGGTATVQRYLDPTFNTGSGYRHYSAPVSGSTVADLATTTGFTPVVNINYNTSAAPGTVTPFPNVFGYDQSRVSSSTNNYSAFEKGFFSPSDLTDELLVGQGYVVQIGADQLVDFTGQLNTGDKTVSLGRNADATAADAGWALVGNPYPAPLDWSQVAAADRTNLDGSIYVVQSSGPYTGSYRAYVNNVAASSTNSPLIGTGQGFFVRVSSGQTSGSLTFRNSQRVTDYTSQAPVYRTTADLRPLVQLELRTSTGQADGVAIYAEAGATASYDAQYDAGKLANSTGLNLASLSAANQPLAIDGRSAFTPATVVPLTVGVPAAGTYSLAVAALHNLPAGLDAFLTDAQTGQTVRLGQQSAYSFSVTATESLALLTGRFTLSFSAAAPLATTPAPRIITEVALYPNPASERFTVQMPAVAGASQVQATLLNALGQVVRRQAAALPAAGTTLTVETAGLPAGVYTLRLQAGATTTAKRVLIK